MPILGLEHVNLRVADPAASIAFFRDVLGMAVTPAPGRTNLQHGGWVLDPAGTAVIHIGGIAARYEPDEVLPAPARRGSGAIHHVALACADYAQVRQRLDDAALTYREHAFPEARVRQLFVEQGDGVLLELNFHDTGAEPAATA